MYASPEFTRRRGNRRMKTQFGKQFADLITEALELQDLEMEVERRRLKVARMQYELEAVIGIGTRVTVPVVRTVQ
jgi:hypothetical protein